MYTYELKNNHYVVNINNNKYLIDTGCPISFWISKPIRELIIDGHSYYLQDRPIGFDVDATDELVGEKVDGFIGMDIISLTGLTIYRSGDIDFKVNNINGKEIPMSTRFPLVVNVGCNLMTGRFIIDTGAKYGYGVTSLFHNQTPTSYVKDYNPSLGQLESELFHLNIVLGGLDKTIDVCNNATVSTTLKRMGAILIGSVSTLYNEVCVLDVKKGRLILK